MDVSVGNLLKKPGFQVLIFFEFDVFSIKIRCFGELSLASLLAVSASKALL